MSEQNIDQEVMEASAPVANKGVVTPEKDPVPKAIASVDKAGDSTSKSKKRKGDSDKGDKVAPKQGSDVKEDIEDMTKMEALRRIIEELKSFGKEDIQSLVNEMDMKDKEDDEG